MIEGVRGSATSTNQSRQTSSDIFSQQSVGIQPYSEDNKDKDHQRNSNLKIELKIQKTSTEENQE